MTVRRALVAFVSLALCLMALGAGIAGAATPGEIAEFKLPPLCERTGLAAARTEGVLLRLCERSGPESSRRGATLGNFLPSGQIAKASVPKAGGGPIAAAPDGTVWMAANAPEFEVGPAIVDRVSPNGEVRRFQLSGRPTGGEQPHVVGLAVGPAGEVWASVGTGVRVGVLVIGGSQGGKLVRIAADGTVTDFPLPHRIEPLAVVEAPDGNLWFTAIRDRRYEEHVYRTGTAYVGRITSAGVLSFYPAPEGDGALTAIAVAKDGGFWVGGPDAEGIDAVGPDGRFGGSYGLGADHVSAMAVGAEGDVWIAAANEFGVASLIRVTPWGQRTRFDLPAYSVVAGAEGDIWAGGEASLARIVPGAPGLDVSELRVSRPSRTAALSLACGGSASACEGNLELRVTFRGRSRRPGGKLKWIEHSLPIGTLPYAVGAESEATVTVDLPAPVLALAGRPSLKVRSLRVEATATVAGGPTMERKLAASALAPPR